jgi:hypothetical protein
MNYALKRLVIMQQVAIQEIEPYIFILNDISKDKNPNTNMIRIQYKI